MPEVNIVVKAKDEASRTLGGIGDSLKGLGTIALGVGAVGGVALLGVAAGAAKLAVDAAKLEPTRITFDNLSQSIGSTSDALLKKLRPAVMGTMADADLMKAANKLMAMGLADTEDKAAKLAEMAVTLGTAMGTDATASLENFTLMLANQSIPRLDTFGISSGQVRERIEELMEATEGLTREQAFMQAVMEIGAESMGKVGDVSGTMAVRMATVQATMTNLKDELGIALMPLLEIFMDNVLSPLMGKISEWAPKITPVIEQFGYLAQAIMDPDQDWVAFLNNEVWEALENAFGADAADKIVNFVEDGIIGLQEFVNDSLLPLVENITTEVIPAFQEWWESDGFKGVLITLEAIGTSIGDLLENIGKLKAAIDDLVDSPGFKWLMEQLTRGQQERFQQWYGGALEELIPPIVARGEAQALQEAYSQQAYVPSGGVNINIGNIYGVDGVDQALDDAISAKVRSLM